MSIARAPTRDLVAPDRTGAGDRDRARPAVRIDSVVCFAIDRHVYALDVSVVREVVRVETLLPVPKTPAPIVGIFALRGATVALVDTRILFGMDSSGARDNTLILARGHRTICGLTIDRVLGVVRFSETGFTPAIPGRDPPQVAGFMPQEGGEGGGLLTVLDASVIVGSLERLRF